MKIKMIGHSSVQIQTGDKKIITDPYFNPMGHIAFKRTKLPYGDRLQYADADLVLVSHNHFDHMDRKFFSMLSEKSQVIMPTAMSGMKLLLGIKNAVGLKRYESAVFGDIKITAVPALHPAFCCGYIIEAEGKCLYFSGDTFYGGFMKELSQKYSIDIALMPVTTFRLPMTMGEKGAVSAVQTLKPKTIIPIHLGISPRLPLMRTNHSVEGFTTRLKNANIASKVVNLPEGADFTA